MKFMKLGTLPDTFYTEEATRSVRSDVRGDLIIHVNGVSFLLHKFLFLSKSHLLQRICLDSDKSNICTVNLDDIPGGEEAFELCAKFCYGISINISAHNFVPAFCASKFLQMSESAEKGNLVLKLESFFDSCILEGWKDSIVALQTTAELAEWSENLGITRRCIESIVEKIVMPQAKVTWSYTYTRPGFDKHQQAVPKDWWTEDISDLEIDLFRCVITAVRSTFIPPPQLIGEALHVYACRWLPDTKKIGPSESSTSQTQDFLENNRKIHETIVNMIPADRGSVSVGFLLKLLSIAAYVGASSVVKTELTRRSSLQLDEASVDDLLFPSHSASNQRCHDTDLVLAVLESYVLTWRRQSPAPLEGNIFMKSIRNIGKLLDSYLQVVAKDVNMPVSQMVALVEALPDIARKKHDNLYKAINIYLKEHPNLSKADKKLLCRSLDCQRLSLEVRAHAVKNERLPLRTVVQLIFFDQEKAHRDGVDRILFKGKNIVATTEDLSKLQLDSGVHSNGLETTSKSPLPEIKVKRTDKQPQLKVERQQSRGKLAKVGSRKRDED